MQTSLGKDEPPRVAQKAEQRLKGLRRQRQRDAIVRGDTLDTLVGIERERIKLIHLYSLQRLWGF